MKLSTLPICLLPVLFIGSAGCVSPVEHQRLEGELGQCRLRMDSVVEDLEGLREEYDQELTRWRDLFEDADGFSTAQFETVEKRLDQIRTVVPPMVQDEVGRHLDELASLLGSQFQEIDERYATLSIQLGDANGKLDEIAAELEHARNRVGVLAPKYGKLIEQVQEFDHRRLDCKSCPEYLHLRKKKADEIANFHRDLINRIGELYNQLLTDLEAEGEA